MDGSTTWETVPLGEVCDFRRGLTYKKSDEVKDNGIPVLRANNVNLDTGELDLSEIRLIDSSIPVPQNKKVQRGSLLICTASGSKKHLGKSALIDDNYDYAFGGFMGLLVPDPRVEPQYLKWLMRSDGYWQFIDGLADGTNINNLKFKQLCHFPVPLPPLEKQRRIVAVLDEVFEDLDRARSNVEANLRDAKELFNSFVASAISGNSQHWPNVTLPEVAQNLDRMRVPITKKDRKPGDVPYYGASGVVDYVADFLFDEDLLLVSEDGANLLARTYPIAFSISGRSWVNNHAHVLQFEESFAQEYVRLFLNSISLAPYVSGMAQPKLNQTALNQIPIPFPSEARRAEIVGRAESIFNESEQLAGAYQVSLEDLSDIRQSLLQRAFAGELT